MDWGQGPVSQPSVEVTLTPTLVVRSLGVILDEFLSMELMTSAVARSAFYYFQMARQLVPYLSTCNLTTVLDAMITSRRDYC